MATILLGILFVGIFVVLMSVGLIFKGKELKGTCASQNPLLLENGVSCSVCGQPVGSCENEDATKQNLEIAQ